ncbi:MAG: AI-2E family transporter, partial [Synechococcus sp.]|nr:AI-2E family transporter [Synechococcus sp.]
LRSRWLWLPLAALNLWAAQALIRALEPMPTLLLVAALVAFLLAQPVAWCRGLGLQRSTAVAVVLGGLTLVLMALMGWLVPLFMAQLQSLLAALPQWIQQATANVQRLDQSLDQWGVSLSLHPLQSSLQSWALKLGGSLSREGPKWLGSGVGFLLHAVMGLFLTLFLLLGGQGQLQQLLGWLPVVPRQRLLRISNQVLRSYAWGLIITAVLYGMALWLVLTLLGIPYALVFSVLISATTLVPYAGAITILLVSAVLLLVSPELGLRFALGAVITGQVIDHSIYPLLMNRILSFSPAAVILIVLFAGQLCAVLGLPVVLGLLLGLPAAAVTREMLQPEPSSELGV